MRKGWEIKKLDEICTIGDGNYSSKYPKASEFISTGVPFLTATNLKNGTIVPDDIRFISEELHSTLTKGHVVENDLVIVVRGSSTGNNSVVPIEYEGSNLNSQLAFLRIKDQRVNSKFLFRVFNSPDIQKVVLNTISGSAQPQLPNNKLMGIKVPIPPLPEQQRIVSLLDEAFEAIDQAKANTEHNLQNARELFQSELNRIFTNKGEGWVEKKLLDVCTLKSGTTISEKLEKVKGEIAYLKVADMNIVGNENRVSTSSRFLDKRDFNVKNIFPVGTIIFPKRGGAIATNKKRITDIPICADLNIMGAIALPIIDSEFLFYFFKKFNLIDIANGTTILQINNYSFEPLTICFPKSLVEQQRIVAQLDAISEETKRLEANYQKKLDGLEELKKSILHKAFSGELTRETTEIQMEQLEMVAEDQAMYNPN